MTPEVLELCKLAAVEYDPGKLLALVKKINQLCDERRAKIAAEMWLDQPSVTTNGDVGHLGYSHRPEEFSLRTDPSKIQTSYVSCYDGWKLGAIERNSG
jgi:hypothetical protein